MESLLEDVDEYADGGMDVYAMKKNSHSAAEKYYDNMRVCFALWKCVCVCVCVCECVSTLRAEGETAVYKDTL